MLVTIQPPSIHTGADSCPLLAVGSTAGGWLAMAWDGTCRGEAAPAHILPCMDQHSHGHPLRPSRNAGLSPLPPAAALRFCTRGCRALHGPAPVPESVCLCLDGEKEGRLTAGPPAGIESRATRSWDLKGKGRRWAVRYSSINPQNEVSLLSANVESHGLPTKSQELIFCVRFFFLKLH